MNPKQLVGEKACEYIQNGMIIGLGTGSTAYFAIQKVGQMLKDGIDIKAVPTSEATKQLAEELGIPLLDINKVKTIDIGIDGADEFDKNKQLIKGGGGALLREKIVASLCKTYICIADYSKKSDYLGSFPLPVEITPFGKEITAFQLEALGCKTTLRKKNNQVFVTDNNNYILDCKFDKIEDPNQLNIEINQIPGVVENGLFVNIATKIICTSKEGKLQIIE